MSETQPPKSALSVGKDGVIYVDGVKVGRYNSERQSIEIVDRDRRRCLQKGREIVEIKLSEFDNLVGNK